MAVDIRGMACAYLRAGAVTLLEVWTADGSIPGWPTAARYVRAQVIGNSGVYRVAYRDGEWSCTCSHSHMQTRTGGDADAAMSVCAHASAVQLVTGHPSRARKEPKR